MLICKYISLEFLQRNYDFEVFPESAVISFLWDLRLEPLMSGACWEKYIKDWELQSKEREESAILCKK